MAALCWTWAAPVLAAQAEYGVGLSATYESNITRTPDPVPEL